MYLPIVSAASDLIAVIRYLAFCISEGDYLNDWITHVTDPDLAAALLVMGEWLTTVF